MARNHQKTPDVILNPGSCYKCHGVGQGTVKKNTNNSPELMLNKKPDEKPRPTPEKKIIDYTMASKYHTWSMRPGTIKIHCREWQKHSMDPRIANWCSENR